MHDAQHKRETYYLRTLLAWAEGDTKRVVGLTKKEAIETHLPPKDPDSLPYRGAYMLLVRAQVLLDREQWKKATMVLTREISGKYYLPLAGTDSGLRLYRLAARAAEKAGKYKLALSACRDALSYANWVTDPSLNELRDELSSMRKRLQSRVSASKPSGKIGEERGQEPLLTGKQSKGTGH